MRRRLRRWRVAVVGARAGQQLERDDRERVTVDGRRRGLAAGLLGREIAGRPEHGSRSREGVQTDGARDAEIGDLHRALLVEEEVRGLDVAVDDATRVGRVERRGGLRKPRQRSPRRLRPFLGDPLGERAVRDVLHHDVRPPLVLADVEDRDDVRRIGEPRSREGLACEAAADALVVREVLGEHLDRDRSAEDAILRSVHLAHAAPRDVLGVAVASRRDGSFVTARACPGRAQRKRPKSVEE